jgi:pimeloyl-ACP methyl ester carboxylesterase
MVSQPKSFMQLIGAFRMIPEPKIFPAVAAVVSCAAIALALDPGHFAFTYVDAGGHKLRMLISGHGSPSVVFETGGSPAAGGPLEGWERVQPAVSQFTRAVSYDRAGTGLSDPGPQPRDAKQVARELHSALHNADVLPPYVLVGHSFGGPMIRVFAGMYPDETAGLVLIDPTQEEFIYWNQARETNDVERQDAEWKEIQASLTEAHESRVPQGIPVVLITGMGPRIFPSFVTGEQKREYREIHQMWLKFHDEWLNTVPSGRHIITENSGHNVPVLEPKLIVGAIHEMIKKTQATSR